MNIVELDNWYAQPIHCPFCGTAFHPTDPNECKHLLYVIFDGNFQDRSERFNELAGLPMNQNDYDPELSFEDFKKYGEPDELVKKVASKVANLTEFQIDNVSDTAYFGFASLENELCGWGLDHVSPYEAQDE